MAVFTRPLIVNGSCIADNESYSRVYVYVRIYARVCLCRSTILSRQFETLFPAITPLKRQPYGKVDSLIFNFIFHNLPSSRTRPSPPPFVPLPFSFHVNYYTRFELENCYTFDFLFRLRIERYIYCTIFCRFYNSVTVIVDPF